MSTDQHRRADERAGPAARQAAGIGVLCLHGFTSSPVFLGYTAGALRGGGVLRVVPHLAGHGATPENLERTGRADWLRSAEQALEDLQPRHSQVLVVGHSMIQLAYEMTFTEQIERLTGQLHETEEL